MKSKTKWFSAKQRPVRNGIYEITSDILGYECLFLCFWNNSKGWYWHLGWIIKRWRGLTKEEYMRRKEWEHHEQKDRQINRPDARCAR